MRFKAATDALTRAGSLTLTRIAERFGITPASLSRMRSDTMEDRSNILRPPEGWPRTLAELARENAEELERRAKELRELASTWDGEAA